MAGKLGPRSLIIDIYSEYNSGEDHRTGAYDDDGNEIIINNVMLEFRMAPGLIARKVDTAVSKGCNVMNEYYVIFGANANDKTAGSEDGSDVWLGLPSDEFHSGGNHTVDNYKNVWWFKYLFVTIMYKEGGVEDDINTTETETATNVGIDYYQRYPLPKSCE